jgi:hypothetical protein
MQVPGMKGRSIYGNGILPVTIIRMMVIVALLTSVTIAASSQSFLRIVFTTDISNTPAGEIIMPPIEVEARNVFNQRVTSYTEEVTLTIKTNPSGGTLSGTTVVRAVNGIAVFDDLRIDKAGTGYTLQAQAPRVATIESDPFTITASQPTRIVKISGDNQSGSVGTQLPNPYILAVLDRFDNPVPGVPIGFSITGEPSGAGASLSTTSTVTGTDGRASTYLTLGSQPGVYTVQATAANFEPLTFTATLPAYTVSGIITRDGVGLSGVEVVATGGHEQSVTTNENGLFTLTDVVHGATGITITPSLIGHVFSPVSRTIAGPVTGNITNQNFTAELQRFTVTGAVTINGVPLSGVTITATGGHAQTVTTNANGLFTLTGVLYGSTNIALTPSMTGYSFLPISRTISGPVTADVSGQNFTARLLIYTISGVVLKENLPVSGVTITATGGHNQSVSTNAEGVFSIAVEYGTTNITITPSLVGHSFSPTSRTISGPVADDITGQNFNAQLLTYTISGTVGGDTREAVSITVTGTQERIVQTDDNGNYTVSGIPHGATVTLTPEKNGFSFDPPRRTYSELASDFNNQNFTSVRWKLSFGQQPTNTIAGTSVDPAITVRVLDVRDELVTSFTGSVSIAIQNNPANGTLSGTRQVDAVGGIATFSDLSIQRAGSGYTLRATAGGMTQATSTSFSVIPAPASRLEFSQGPTNVEAGRVFSPPVTVRAYDAFDNHATGFGNQVRMTIDTNPSGGILIGSDVIIASNGVALFDDLRIDKIGTGYRLRAEADRVGSIVSSAFNVVPGEPAKLRFTQGPSATQAGSILTPPLIVEILDAGDNLVTAFDGTVTLDLLNNPGDGRLFGTTQKRAADGRATFDDISIRKTGSGYTISAEVSEVGSIESEPFDITSAPAERLVILSGNDQIGTVATQLPEPFTVQVIDQFENPVSGIATTFSIISQPEHAEASLSDLSILTDDSGMAASSLTLGIRSGIYNVRVSIPELDPVVFVASLPGYEISGMIEGQEDDDLTGITVTASGGYSMSTPTDDSGFFLFTEVPRGTENVSLTPRREGYGFIPASVQIRGPIEGDTGDIKFELTRVTLVITGRVTYEGSGFGNVVMVAKGGHNASVSTDANGEYTFTDVAYGASDVTVFPSYTGYRFTPISRTITGPLTRDYTLSDFTAVMQNFSISGRVTHGDRGIPDVTIAAVGGHATTVQTDPEGRYQLNGIPYGAGTISIAPSKEGYLFDPETATVNGPLVGDIGNVDFGSKPPAPPMLIDPPDAISEQPNRITFSWSEVTGAQSYNLSLATDTSFAGPSVVEITGIDGTQQTVTDLAKGTTYFWRVNAGNLVGNGPWSEVRRFTTSVSMKYLTIRSPEEGDIWEVGEQYSIHWQSQEVDELRIEFSADDGVTWNTVISAFDASHEAYVWTVPDVPTTNGRIRVTDTGDEYFQALSGAFTIYPVIVPVTHTMSFGNANTITSYRMIGLPGNARIPLTQVLTGEPRKDWTAFLDNGAATDHLIEFDGSGIFSFEPGNGFWILSRNGLHVHHEVDAVHLGPDKTFPIPLQSGWNIISNPYTQAVPWSAVRETNDISEPIWDFDGSYVESDSLKPYRGYYLYNATGLSTLRIPYPNGSNGNEVARHGSTIAGSLSLTLEHDGHRSRPVRVHLLDKEQETVPSQRKYAPPGDFEEATITIRNESITTTNIPMAEDVRTPDGSGQAYPIVVKLKTDTQAHLHISGIESFNEPVIALIDRKTGRHYDLREGGVPNILNGIGEREFLLVIGSQEYMAAVADEALPVVYHLSNNYPNPFNPVTSIEYSIPGGSTSVPVKLEVFDLLGRRIRLLVDDVQDSGFYRVTWDGRNERGEAVASGVYVYILKAGSFSDSKRMVLIK